MKFIPELLSSCLKISKLGLALTTNHELSIISLSLSLIWIINYREVHSRIGFPCLYLDEVKGATISKLGLVLTINHELWYLKCEFLSNRNLL